MNFPVVSWAGPVEQASQRLRDATDFLEKKKIAKGLAELRQAKAEIDTAIAFIETISVADPT